MYSTLARLAHWAIVLLAITQFPTGRVAHRTSIRNPFGVGPSAFDLLLEQVHFWSGWTMAALSLVLLVQRLMGRAPALPTDMKTWQVRLSLIGHVLLYGTLAALVVSGTLSTYFWSGLRPAHQLLVWVGVVLVSIHIAAALWHHFIRRDGVLLRILPRVQSAPTKEVL